MCDGAAASRIGFSGGVEAEDSEIVGRFAGFGKGDVEEFGFVGFDFEDEAVGPGLAMDWAAFDFAEIDVAMGEGFEGGEECPRAMGELHRDRHFAHVGSRWKCGGVRLAAQ